MKTLIKVLIVLLIITFFSTIYFYSKDKKTSLDIEKIRKQNDSLFSVISINNKKIDSFENNTQMLLTKNNELKKKMVSLDKKANEYKKEHEEDINYINSLSNNDIAKLFANEFK